MDFELEAAYDFLTIFDGGMRGDTIATLTGTTLPPEVMSPTSGSTMTVLMESDGSNHLRGARWEVKAMCDLLSEGPFVTPGYGSDGYPNFADMCWSFIAPAGDRVRMTVITVGNFFFLNLGEMT